MEQAEMTVERREKTGSAEARRLRRGGRLPANVYGQGAEPVAIHVDNKTFEDALRSHVRIFHLESPNGKDAAVLHDLQHDEVTDELLHADFLRVDLSKKVDVQVAISVLGPSAGEMAGGVMVEQLSMVTVRCLPTAIPESIKIDSRELGLGEGVHVRDLEMPEGVEVVEDPDRSVIAIAVPRGVDSEEGEGEGDGGEGGDES